MGFFERLFSFAAASSSLKGEVGVTGHLVVILISQNSKEYLGEMWVNLITLTVVA